MKTAALVAIIVVGIVSIVIGLIAYSYTQIQISLNDISYQSLDFATPSATTILKLAANFITGNWIGLALTLVTGVKIGLVFGLSNHGFVPVYIPDVSYDIIVNDVKVGQGQSHIDTTINPGETRSFSDNTQDVQFTSIEPAIASIVDSGGTVNLKVSGTAYFKFLGISVPVPFQSTKQINVMDEIKNHINSYISQQNSNEYSQGSSQTPQLTNLGVNLPGTTITNSVYKVLPGRSLAIGFVLSCAATVNGGFSANAALGDNIMVIILDHNEFLQFQHGMAVPSYYSSGKVASGNFNVSLSPGDYYIVLLNTYSVISTKTVTLEAYYNCS